MEEEVKVPRLYGEVIFHQMKLPRKERFGYVKDFLNSYKVGRDDTGKHKHQMRQLLVNGTMKRGPISHANKGDRLI